MSEINNKRIAINTLYLYVRMFVIMGVTLFTARIVIRALGIDDYGIYNIVGGVVVLFSFINIALRSSIQRFISYELGRHDMVEVHKIFNLSLYGIGIVSIGCFIFAETIGYWFLNNKLNIPDTKIYAANWVFQFSVFTFIVNLFQTLYQATIISYEKMSFFTWYSSAEVILKLVVALLIDYCESNRLIIYSSFILIVSVISLIASSFYCHSILQIPIRKFKDKKKLNSIMSLSGWGMINSSTVIIAQQGGNILINIFGGIIANGAYGIANQVSAAIYQFVSNFQSAFNPQIVKSYSSKEYAEMFKLIIRSSKISFYLLLIIAVPFFIGCGEILRIWLGEEPVYASGFCKLLLIYFLIDASQAPLWMLINATGRVRTYQIWAGSITLLNIPISWLVLHFGGTVFWVFIVRIILNFLCAIIRPLYVTHLIRKFSISQYFSEVVLPIIKVILISLILVGVVEYLKLSNVMVNMSICFILTVGVIWKVGLQNNERRTLKKMLFRFLRK